MYYQFSVHEGIFTVMVSWEILSKVFGLDEVSLWCEYYDCDSDIFYSDGFRGGDFLTEKWEENRVDGYPIHFVDKLYSAMSERNKANKEQKERKIRR